MPNERTIESWGTLWHQKPTKGSHFQPDRSEGMWWPAGQTRVPSSRLKQLLARSARWHARTAISGYISEDLDTLLQTAVSCGSAVELIIKAYCASVSHSLLADKGERDSILMLVGQSTLATNGPTQMRSIGVFEAIRFLKHLHKDVPIEIQDPISIRVRNSATHMALVDSDELRKAILQMCRVIDKVLPLLELDIEPFWGDNAFPVAVALIDEAKSEIARTVEAKLSVARARLDTLTSSLPADQVAAVLTALSGRLISESDHEDARKCPACEQQGWLLCTVEVGETQFAEPDDMWATQTAYPFEFRCPVCQLELAGEELLEFDFPEEIELEDITDPQELLEEEPDEDMYRGT